MINNGVMTSGSIVGANGSTTVVVVPTLLTALINYAPVASFIATINNLVATITDTSSDPNSPTLPDSWNYLWNFGDGATTTANVATVGNNQTHTYVAPGTYTISLVLTDQYGLTSNASNNVTAISTPAVTPPSGGGGGGSGAGGVSVYGTGYYVGSVPLDSLGKVKGDINRDGKVDMFDFNILLVQWGKTGNNLSADLNSDGVVDIIDFNQLQVYWSNK